MSTIDVLWLEDEPKESFINLAKDEDFDINLIWKATASEAIEYIKKNIDQLDGAILDARGHLDPNDQLGEAGLYKVKDELKMHYLNRPIPVAVITGQEDLLRKDGFVDTLNTRLFRKNGDEDAVLEFIRDGAKELDDVKIKTEHHLAFKIFDETVVKEIVLDSKIRELKKQLIEQLKAPVNTNRTPRIIRGFFEGLIFPLMHHYGMINKSYIKFNDEARYFSIDKKIYSEDQERLFRAIAFCCQGLNHEKPDIKIVNYLQETQDPYYIDSLFKGLLSLLTWLPDFITHHPQESQ